MVLKAMDLDLNLEASSQRTDLWSMDTSSQSHIGYSELQCTVDTWWIYYPKIYDVPKMYQTCPEYGKL